MKMIGKCSICLGTVSVPATWLDIKPPQPKCQRCGAVAEKPYNPVIRMVGVSKESYDRWRINPWFEETGHTKD